MGSNNDLQRFVETCIGCDCAAADHCESKGVLIKQIATRNTFGVKIFKHW